MQQQQLINLITSIVSQATDLVAQHIPQQSFPVNYACIFAQTNREYVDLNQVTEPLGSVIKETQTGNVYQIAPLPTVAGGLQLVKIRVPDQMRSELGDADFTVVDFAMFKQTFLHKPGFSLIERPTMQMVELIDPQYAVRAYFSNPPLTEQLELV